MSNFLASRVKHLETSATLAVSARAKELQAQGRKIIDLSLGEPDFDTPNLIKEAGIQAIQRGGLKYTLTEGLVQLREAIRHKLQRDNQLSYQLDEIIAACGVKHALYNLALATLNPGDEAIVLAPYWVSYPPIVKMAEATPVILTTDVANKFEIPHEALISKINSKTRWIILNSPNNPTGMCYRSKDLRVLADILLKHPNILVISDDIYEYIYWGKEPFANILNVCPDLRERTVILNGLSKAYAMTGWRLGYAAGPKPVIQAMKKIQSQSVTCASAISQLAAIRALEINRNELDYMKVAYQRRHDHVFEAIIQIPGVECASADGAFYLFPKMQAVIDRLGLSSDIELANFLLTEAGVAVVPGSAFGAPGYIRLSSATSDEALQEAVKQIKSVI